jgi:hypothetical protein
VVVHLASLPERPRHGGYDPAELRAVARRPVVRVDGDDPHLADPRLADR